MPFLKIQTNVSVDENKQAELLTRASALTASELGKPESYVMVSIEPERIMSFAGNSAPLAYLELKSIGLQESQTADLSKALCDLVASSLEIDQGRVYIEFADAPRAMWGWNGATF